MLRPRAPPHVTPPPRAGSAAGARRRRAPAVGGDGLLEGHVLEEQRAVPPQLPQPRAHILVEVHETVRNLPTRRDGARL
jgi:hypothetical protein